MTSHPSDLNGPFESLIEWFMLKKFLRDPMTRLARHFRDVEVLQPGAFDLLHDRLDNDESFGQDFDDLMWLDVFARGARRWDPERRPVFIVVEISLNVRVSDVERIERRARILRALDLEVAAIAIGQDILEDARALANSYGGIVLFEDGEPGVA